MQLGKSILGAIVGAVVGFFLLLAVYLLFQVDGVWLSIPFAIVTGIGVRMFANTSGNASYVRGAMTMLLALVAYIAGWTLVGKIAMARANAPGIKVATTSGEESATEPDEGEAKEAETKEADAKAGEPKEGEPQDGEKKAAEKAPKAAKPKPKPIAKKSGEESAAQRMSAPRGSAYTTWDIIFLAISALVAYELGRGSGMATAAAGPAGQPIPAGTHPDA